MCLQLQWCEQTVPACGSYQQNLVGLLLPAFAQAISAEENGQTKEEALGDVMPPLLQVCFPCHPPLTLACVSWLSKKVNAGSGPMQHAQSEPWEVLYR